MKKISTLIAALLCVISLSAQTDKRTKIELQTSMGKIIVELFNETPLHRDNFIKQVKAGTYNGVLWHRVINNFLIQTGDETPSVWITAEFRTPEIFHQRGMLNAAREGDESNPEKKSSSTQFTIITGQKFTDEQLDLIQKRIDIWTNGTVKLTEEMRNVYKQKGGAPHLDGSYTVFGQVIKGMDIVDKIQKVETNKHDRPLKDIKIKRAKILK